MYLGKEGLISGGNKIFMEDGTMFFKFYGKKSFIMSGRMFFT